MQPYRYSQHISAPREKVWHVLLDDATYRQWTMPFNPGSHFVGTWEQGSEIRFMGPDPKDEQKSGGMIAVVDENRPNEFVSVRYTGQMVDGADDTESEDAKRFIGATESYTLTEEDGGTRLDIELAGGNMPPEIGAFFAEAWPKALAILKDLAEA